MRRIELAAMLLAVTVTSAAFAGITNDIPSCYEANRMPVQAPAPDIELFVLIDQTTPLDTSLQNSVREHVSRLVKPGSSFVIGQFSSFSQGRYMEITSAGALEGPLNQKQRDDISVKLLRSFDECIAGQSDYGRKLAAKALNKALAGNSPDLAKSDILGSLKEVSDRVRLSTAKTKIVLLVSDMLENSGISSFYEKKNVRPLDVDVELRKAEAAKQIGDLGKARIFVLGAGIVQESAGDKHRDSGVYRNPKTMAKLKDFWEKYFAKSNASLIEFGAPALMMPVQ